jgi:hypothetical protein
LLPITTYAPESSLGKFFYYPFRYPKSVKSETELPKIMEVINEPVLFWLDAHIDDSSVTYNELKIIKNHHIKTHTLLIDDINLYFNKNELIDNILKINPDYMIGYESTWRGNDEILVAKLKN